MPSLLLSYTLAKKFIRGLVSQSSQKGFLSNCVCLPTDFNLMGCVVFSPCPFTFLILIKLPFRYLLPYRTASQTPVNARLRSSSHLRGLCGWLGIEFKQRLLGVGGASYVVQVHVATLEEDLLPDIEKPAHTGLDPYFFQMFFFFFLLQLLW